jgi:hypothetical protein
MLGSRCGTARWYAGDFRFRMRPLVQVQPGPPQRLWAAETLAGSRPWSRRFTRRLRIPVCERIPAPFCIPHLRIVLPTLATTELDDPHLPLQVELHRAPGHRPRPPPSNVDLPVGQADHCGGRSRRLSAEPASFNGCRQLAAQFWRLARRIGKKRAAGAVGDSILVVARHLLAYNGDDRDLGGDLFVQRDADRARHRAVAQLQALGYLVTLQPTAAEHPEGFTFQDEAGGSSPLNASLVSGEIGRSNFTPSIAGPGTLKSRGPGWAGHAPRLHRDMSGRQRLRGGQPPAPC